MMGIRQQSKLQKGDMINWYFLLNGKKVQRATGQIFENAQSLKVARKLGERIEDELKSQMEGLTSAQGLTLNDLHELIKRYSKTRVTRESYDKDKKGSNLWFAALYKFPAFTPSTPVCSITGEMLEDYVKFRQTPNGRRKGASADTITREVFLAVKRGIELAKRKGRLKWSQTKLENYDWKELKETFIGTHIPDEKLVGRFIEEADYLALCRVLPTDAREVAKFIYHTGIRGGGELSQIKADMLQYREGRAYISLPGTITKNHKPRRIPLNDTALAAMKHHIAKNEATVFSRVDDALQYACEKVLHVEQITLRDLRHTFATRLLRKLGGDAASVARIMGHSKEMCLRYWHPNEEDADSAIRGFSEV